MEEGSHFRLFLVGRGRAENTANQYDKQRRRWLSWCADCGISPCAAAESDILSYLAILPSQASRLVTSSALKYYYDFLDITPNPARRIKVRTENAKRPAEPFTQQEMDALYSACQTPLDRALYLMLVSTAVRASELCKMRLEDVDWFKGEVRIYGKGGKWRPLRLPVKTLQALLAYKSTPDRWWGYERPIRYTWLDVWFKTLGTRAGLRPPVHLHRTRVSFAVTFCDLGGKVEDLQEILGHSSIQQSLYYSRRGRTERALAAMVKLNPVDALELAAG